MKSVTYYYQTAMALLKGDRDAANILANQERLNAGITLELAKLECDLLNAKDELSQAELKLEEVQCTPEKITDVSAHLKLVVKAANTVEDKEEFVETIKKAIKFHKDYKELLNRRVEAEV